MLGPPTGTVTTVCFSMLASVASSTTLAVAGAVTVTMVRRRAELPLALLPLLFGLQQLVEAVVWWSLEHDAAVLNNASTFTYMLFSHVWWPVFVPLTFLCIETVSWRRKVLSVFAAIGSGVAVQGLYTVLVGPATSRVLHGSIQYEMPPWLVIALYVLCTCVAAFFSSRRFVRGLGAAALALALLTLWLYLDLFVSVWCFFCAVLTVAILVYFVALTRADWSRGTERALMR